MAVLIKNVRVIDCSAQIDIIDDVYIGPGLIELSPNHVKGIYRTIDGTGKVLTPGLVDLHVHFREPGFTYKEDIKSGIKAALAGGVTSALVMPNTVPVIDQPKHVYFQLQQGKKAGFDLMVAAAASEGLHGENPSDIAALKQSHVKAITDDGKPILSRDLFIKILKLCRRHDLVCMQHAEDLNLSCGHAVNQGRISEKFNMAGQPALAESSLVARDLELALSIGARYHVLHLSCKNSLKEVRKAKQKKGRVSCEVTPHHLSLNEQDIFQLDTNKKMNPPLRSKEDVLALIEGLFDRSIDAVATDHAPHANKEKRRAFIQAPFGVVGLESAILVLLTLVKKEGLPLKRAIELMTSGPATVLGEQGRIGTMMGEQAAKNAVLLDPDFSHVFSLRNLQGRSKNSPFIGSLLYGKVMATFLNGYMAFESI